MLTPLLNRRLASLLVLAVLSGMSGCNRHSPGDLVTPAELDELDAQLSIQLDAMPKTCQRNVLRGAPLPGSATNDMLAVQEALLADDCAKALESAPDDAGAALPHCRAALQSMRRAVAHPDACSPWRPGLRPDSPFRIPSLGRLAVAEAKVHLAAGDSLSAARLLLDTIRFSHDAARGQTSLLVAIVGLTAGKAPLETLPDVLATLDPAQLASVRPELALLSRDVPHFSDILAGEHLAAQLYLIVPLVKGPSYSPPGGYDEHGPPTAGNEESFTGDPAQDGALVWLAARRSHTHQTEACPPGSALSACISGLKAVEAKYDAKEALSTVDMLKANLQGKGREAARNAALDILMKLATPQLSRYADQFKQRADRLAALSEVPHAAMPNR